MENKNHYYYSGRINETVRNEQRYRDTIKKFIAEETILKPVYFYLRIEGVTLWTQFVLTAIEDRLQTDDPLAIVLVGKQNPFKKWFHVYGQKPTPAHLLIIEDTTRKEHEIISSIKQHLERKKK